jgi:hypothetical protein
MAAQKFYYNILHYSYLNRLRFIFYQGPRSIQEKVILKTILIFNIII